MDEEHWDSVLTGAIAAIDLLASRLRFTEQNCHHRHGPHKAKAFGFSYGGGQRNPGMLGLGDEGNQAALEEFAEDPNVRRLTGFANGEWLFRPCLYRHALSKLAGFLQRRLRFMRPNYLLTIKKN